MTDPRVVSFSSAAPPLSEALMVKSKAARLQMENKKLPSEDQTITARAHAQDVCMAPKQNKSFHSLCSVTLSTKFIMEGAE